MVENENEANTEVQNSNTKSTPDASVMLGFTAKNYGIFASITTIFALIAGLLAGNQPEGAGWRFFSYHPLFMTLGFVGLMGNGALIKKLGGYKNTKLHGYLAMGGLALALSGWYVIYKNKENMGKPHVTSTHAQMGVACLVPTVGVGLAGSILLHPDFGIAKTNKNFRFAHKWGARVTMAFGWYVCFTGISKLTSDNTILAFYGLPLLGLLPFTLT